MKLEKQDLAVYIFVASAEDTVGDFVMLSLCNVEFESQHIETKRKWNVVTMKDESAETHLEESFLKKVYRI